MSTPTPQRVDDASLSAECQVVQLPGYTDLHGWCNQRDVPMPHSKALLLLRRCQCTCQRRASA